MPRKKQKLTDKPTEKVIEKLFPKKAVDNMKNIAREKKHPKPSQ